jgi:glucuronoarabinoxylan endo-1,4-beta-xylanase
MSDILQYCNIFSSWAGDKAMTPESEAGQPTGTSRNSRTDPFTRTRRLVLAHAGTGYGAAASVLALALTVASTLVTVSCSHLPSHNLVGSQQAVPDSDLAQIDLATRHQIIVGFGASSGWTSPTMDDLQADAFFIVDKGIGLSLLRLRIAPDGTTLELATAKQAIAHGVSVWAAPWSPPAEWKDNHDVNNGGHLLPEHRQDWADRLATFAANATAEGVPLIGLSAQNEPGHVPEPPNSWETCEYTPASLTEFVRDYLGPTLAKQGLSLPIIAPETGGWDKFDGFASSLLADPVAAAYVGPIATHSYSGTAHVLAIVQNSGHQVWQTEYTDLRDTRDTGMGSALNIAARIHADLVQGNVSAWHHWQYIAAAPYPYSGLMDGKELTRRAWVIGNWSRFVRPGFVRVEATPSPQTGISVSAFSDPATSRLVIVFVNARDLDVPQNVSIANGTIPATFTVWTTSEALALKQSGILTVSSDGTFTTMLPVRSVITLVSDLPGATPSVSP